MPQELREQVPVIQEVLAAMDIEIVTKEGYEADDILGTPLPQMRGGRDGSYDRIRRPRPAAACNGPHSDPDSKDRKACDDD